jgi:hypothetical protein
MRPLRLVQIQTYSSLHPVASFFEFTDACEIKQLSFQCGTHLQVLDYRLSVEPVRRIARKFAGESRTPESAADADIPTAFRQKLRNHFLGLPCNCLSTKYESSVTGLFAAEGTHLQQSAHRMKSVLREQ